MIDEAMARSLKLLNRFAGSDLARRLGLQEPAQRLLFEGSRAGFQAVDSAIRTFKPLVKLARPQRMGAAPAGPGLFDLTPTDEQKMMQDTTRRFAQDVLRPAARAADGACAPPADLLEKAQEIGILQLAVPEELGGFGQARSPITDALVIEELARGDMALAWAVLAPLSVIHALVDHGTAEQQGRYLAAFARDEVLAAATAMLEPRTLGNARAPKTRARRDGTGWRLSGEKSMVPLGQTAAFWLVSAEAEGLGPRMFIVERGTAGLAIAPERTMGLRGADLAQLCFEDVSLDAGALLGGAEAPFDLGELLDRGRIAWTAMATGTCQAVLDYVIPYCNERVAFGEPITNRQSVAFLIADIAIELDCLRLMNHRAASLAERGADFARSAALAHLQASDKGMKIGTDGVQLLGGAGFITEHPVELWYRHLRAIGVVEGGLLV